MSTVRREDRPRVLLLNLSSDSLLWGGLRSALCSIGEVRVAGSATDTSRAIEQALASVPDVIFVEPSEQRWQTAVTGFVTELRDACPASKVVVVAPSFQPSEFIELAALGVQGFILWRDLDLKALRHCLGAVLGGELIVASRSVASELLHAHRQGRRSEHGPARLTGREAAVLRGLAQGQTQQQIATTNDLSLRTVKRTVAGLEDKLQAPSAFVLGAKARALGLVPALG